MSVRLLLIIVMSSALSFAATSSTSIAAAQENRVIIRGQKQDLHHYPPTGAPLHKRVLFVPGLRGQAGWAVDIAQTLASWGYEVAALDTKIYLDGFTTANQLTDVDVMNDLRGVAERMTNRSGERVTLVGWSEGAGLSVLAAAAERNKSVFTGVVAFGLSDENVIGWHWADNLISHITKLNEPTFKASQYMARIAPLPVFILQSSHDEDVPTGEVKQLFDLAREPKRFVVLEGRNHRFEGNQDEFFRTLRTALQWVDQAR